MTADPIDCLALDIGGVFHGDSWETIFATELAAFYNIDMATVRRWGADIWDAHAHSPSSEAAYWRDWEARLGAAVDLDQVHRLIERDVWVDPSVVELTQFCRARGIAVAIVSNNTDFWYRQEMRRAGMTPFMPDIRAYLSCDTGYSKAHPEGGLALLARDRPVATTLFVDDRPDNVAAAGRLGMTSLLYTRRPGLTLHDALLPHLVA